MKLYRPFKNDKVNHALYGVLIYAVLRLVSVFLFHDALPDYACLGLAAFSGLALEVYQGITKTGTADYKDYLAVFFPVVILYVIETILKK